MVSEAFTLPLEALLAEQIRQVNEEQDSSAVAHRLASQALQEEERKRQSVRQKLDGAAKAKKDETTGKVRLDDGRLVPPMATFMQSATEDFTAIPDKLIKRNEYGKFHVRWVRRVDLWDNPSDTEIGYYQKFGFEVIKGQGGDPNKPFERREFVAMQGPPEGFAAFLARNARPGSDVYDQAFEGLEDLANATNKKAGRRVVEIVTAEDHGPEKPHRVSL